MSDTMDDSPAPARTGADRAAAAEPAVVASRAGDPLDEALAQQRELLKERFPLPPAQPPGRRTRRRRAGVAMLAVGAVALVAWADPAWRTERHASAFGERREVALADGSHLTLDASTRVAVSWHLRSRRVALEAGRVRCAVAPSAWRPFALDAGAARVRVLGTVFDVDRQAGRVVVTVLRGRVRMDPAGADGGPGAVLVAGERAAAQGGAASAVLGPVRSVGSGADGEAASAWTEGRLVFRATPLAEALADLQRYRHGPLRVHGPEVAAMQLSGVFDAAQSDRVLDLLPRILPVVVDRQTDGSVDVRRR